MFEHAVEEINKILENLQTEAEELKIKAKIPEENSNRLEDICKSIEKLKETVECLGKDYELYQLQLVPEDVGFPFSDKSKSLGSGSFGEVYLSTLNGVKVAVKIDKGSEENDFENEIKNLRLLRHDNIIAFRGNGTFEGNLFVVMEYIKDNLLTFIKSRSSHDGSGLSAYRTWDIAHQIANGLKFLHSKLICHNDIKPDNILIDTEPIHPKVKLCDFGLSGQTGKGHKRYAPKSVKKEENEEPAEKFENAKKSDVFAFGLVVLETRTGKRPWNKHSTNQLKSYVDEHQETLTEVEVRKSVKHWHIRDIEVADIVIGENLGELIKACCAADRPSFETIVEKFFDGTNPYKMKEAIGEFFACGFLTNTNIFVVDSVVPETKGHSGTTADLPTYKHSDLICKVEITANTEDYIFKDEDMRNNYYDNLAEFNAMAKKNIIDNNPILALKEIVSDREGEEEEQGISLRFIQSNYCHHRAMREIWRKFDERQKNRILYCKSEVNKFFSTSFGLHVAILTCEKGGKKKFVFTQRSKKKGVAAPGAYTCGAVESCSVKDFVEGMGDVNTAWVSLISTAARGIHEELGLELKGDDLEAIYLNTTYLKFDFHEWGICGFVDLTDKRIREENRLSFDELNTAFTSGPKDKFEHSTIQGVDFDLITMVEWIRAHHLEMASSGKIAVVKVLQAFFGMSAVTKEFQKYMPTE